MHAEVPGLKHCFDILHVAFMFFFYYAPIKLKLRFVQKTAHQHDMFSHTSINIKRQQQK